MYFLTFVVFLPLFLISLAVFAWGVLQLAKNSPRARDIIAAGFTLGLLSLIVGALIFGLT